MSDKHVIEVPTHPFILFLSLHVYTGLKHTPLAALSRPVVGTRFNTLICTLPGRHVPYLLYTESSQLYTRIVHIHLFALFVWSLLSECDISYLTISCLVM